MTHPISQRSACRRRAERVFALAWPRYLNVALGTWLFLSIYVWTHAPDARSNTWTVGVMIAVAALTAARTPAVRWCNTALALWLALSTLAMSDVERSTFYNNLIVAALVFVLSLIPNPVRREPPSGVRVVGHPERCGRELDGPDAGAASPRGREASPQ